MTLTHALIAACGVLLAVLLAYAWRFRRLARRERSLRHLLDGADAMEALLHRTRERMQAMQGVLGRVPSDIAATATQASQASDEPVRAGLREVLEHRLWIQRHGMAAAQPELDQACAALDQATARIAAGLRRLEHAGAELDRATADSDAAAAREPAALRRAAE